MVIDENIINFFKKENLYDKDFFDFIEGKVVMVPNDTDMFWYGCHPIIENDILVDIRLVITEVFCENDILINIHELIHAIELYSEIGTIYEERIEEREKKAKEMEIIYLKSR